MKFLHDVWHSIKKKITRSIKKQEQKEKHRLIETDPHLIQKLESSDVKIKIHVVNMFRNMGNGGGFHQRTGIYKTNEMKIPELESSVTNTQSSIDGLVAHRPQLKRGFMNWKAHFHKVSSDTRRKGNGSLRKELLGRLGCAGKFRHVRNRSPMGSQTHGRHVPPNGLL